MTDIGGLSIASTRGVMHDLHMGVAVPTRAAIRTLLPYETVVGAVMGTVRAAAQGGALMSHVHAGIAEQEHETRMMKAQYPVEYQLGQALGLGSGTVLAKAGVLAAHETLSAATGIMETATGLVREAIALKNLYRSARVATITARELGEMASPAAPARTGMPLTEQHPR